MKALLITLATAAALTIAIAASGFALDAASGLSILCAAGIAGGFVTDYSRTSRHRYDAVKAPAVAPVRRARTARPATPEFASVIIFNTTCA